MKKQKQKQTNKQTKQEKKNETGQRNYMIFFNLFREWEVIFDFDFC